MRFKPDICSADIKNLPKDVVLPLGHQEGAEHYNDVHSERYAITVKALAKVPLQPDTDSAFPIFDLGFTPEQIETLISVIGVPEQRRDTINVIGRKVGPVVNRYPESHELYVAADA